MSVLLLMCRRDPGPLDTGQAHKMMQQHLECDVSTCAARRRARTTLVEAKAMVLDTRATPIPAAAAQRSRA